MTKRTRDFNYGTAFSRNIGWVSPWEQALLREKTVAIAGMGGVGGVHLLTLARLGVGGFRIADPDTFEQGNFNRQAGATMSSIGLGKAAVMGERARDIQPDLRLHVMEEAVGAHNVDELLSGADLYVDSLDLYALPARRVVFRRCRELGIPAITAAPIGMGAAYLVFTPEGMGFDEYFALAGKNELDDLAAFLVGVGPASQHAKYLVQPDALSIAEGRLASTGMACQICAGVAGTEALKLLLGRGRVYPAPHYHQFDAFQGRFVRRRQWAVGSNPLHAIKRRFARAFVRRAVEGPALEPAPRGAIERILDEARWAPSGDNSQPWRFEIRGPETVRMHLCLPHGDPYDVTGDATVLTGGVLLETMRAAASGEGRRLRAALPKRSEHSLSIDVSLPRAEDLQEDPNRRFIRLRSVDRRRYRTTPLTAQQKAALAGALGPDMEVRWLEGTRQRLAMARVNALATDLRLRLPEAYDHHREVLDFNQRKSPTGLAAQSIGLNPITLRAMRWAMGSRSRNEQLTRLTGTLGPRIELDLIPGICSAAHFAVTLRRPAADRTQALVMAGQQLQRMWLTATRLGLVLQPTFAPVAFARYADKGVRFTEREESYAAARVIAASLYRLVASDSDRLIFAGRIGTPVDRVAGARSVRRSLAELLIERSDDLTMNRTPEVAA